MNNLFPTTHTPVRPYAQTPILCIILPVFCFLIITSCNPDDQNFTATRDTYVGLWHTEIYQNGSLDVVYDMEILNHPSESSKILLDDFHQLGKGVYRAEAIVSNTQIDIYQQTVGTYVVSGFGTLKNEGKVLDLNYRIDDQSGTGSVEYTATLTKK